MFLYLRLRELCQTDFHKPAFYRSGRAWANAWSSLCRKPFRIGRGRRAAVALMASCCAFWTRFFFPSNAHGLLRVSGTLTSFITILVAGCVQASIIYFVGFVRLLCTVCRRPTSLMRELYVTDFQKPGVYRSGRAGLTRGTCYVARRLELAGGVF